MRGCGIRASVTVTGLCAAVMTLLVACGGAAPTATPTQTPGPTAPLATPTATGGRITHPSGPTDVVLRMQSGGGLVPPGFFATDAPVFTLYGDGTAIFRPATDPTGTGLPPFMKATLDAAQVDSLLDFAMTTGTVTFTIDAGGISKSVSVYALGISNNQANPDSTDYEAFLQLSVLLGDFEEEIRLGHAASAGIWAPSQYRAILIEAPGAQKPMAWPWDDLKLDDFVVDTGHGSVRLAALTSEQAAKLTAVPSGGIRGVSVASPDGTTQFAVSLRPMLPGDTIIPATGVSFGI